MSNYFPLTQVTLDSVNNSNFVGSIRVPEGNIAECLLQKGFAKCVDWSMAFMKNGKRDNWFPLPIECTISANGTADYNLVLFSKLVRHHTQIRDSTQPRANHWSGCFSPSEQKISVSGIRSANCLVNIWRPFSKLMLNQLPVEILHD